MIGIYSKSQKGIYKNIININSVVRMGFRRFFNAIHKFDI